MNFMFPVPEASVPAKDICNFQVKREKQKHNSERFEPRSHFKSRLSLIVWVNIVLNRTVVVDSPIQDYVHPDDQTQPTFKKHNN